MKGVKHQKYSVNQYISKKDTSKIDKIIEYRNRNNEEGKEMPKRTTGMGGHQSAKMMKDEWLTPPDIIKALGEFDLDPCSPINRPWETANTYYTIENDGLSQKWSGRVWLNPPYGRKSVQWLDKLSQHGNGIALIFARTETDMFFKYVWDKADALLFFRGRLYFHHVSGERARANAGAPSVLVAYGKNNVESLERVKDWGKLVLQ